MVGRLLLTIENIGGATNGYIAEPAVMHSMTGIVLPERRPSQNPTKDSEVCRSTKYFYVQIAILIDRHGEMSYKACSQNIFSKHVLQFLGNRRCWCTCRELERSLSNTCILAWTIESILVLWRNMLHARSLKAAALQLLDFARRAKVLGSIGDSRTGILQRIFPEISRLWRWLPARISHRLPGDRKKLSTATSQDLFNMLSKTLSWL